MSQVVVNSGKARGGKRTVRYRNANGESYDAVVVSNGTNSGKKLMVPSFRGGAIRYIDDVPLATSMKGTNCYFNHWPRY